MHLVDQRFLGWIIVLLLAALVAVKRAATGSVLEKPEGGARALLVNLFNLCFLLVVNPLTAVLLIARRLPAADPTHVALGGWPLVAPIELAGLVVYLAGFALMAWALVVLGRNYQLGGSAPRPSDRLVAAGPYARVRHPMYSAALCIALGLALLVQSAVIALLFVLYLVLIVLLIPAEEDGLRRAYGAPYDDYAARTRRLLPGVY